MMRSYYKFTNFKRDTTADRYGLHRAIYENFSDLQHLTEQRMADQLRTVIKNNVQA